MSDFLSALNAELGSLSRGEGPPALLGLAERLRFVFRWSKVAHSRFGADVEPVKVISIKIRNLNQQKQRCQTELENRFHLAYIAISA